MNEDARRLSHCGNTDLDFQSWCVEIVDRMTPVRERFTPFPRYFEIQALNFVVMRSLLRDLFPLDRRYGMILEIGCGVGVHSVLLSRFCDELLGVDIPGEYAGYTPLGFKSSADVARCLAQDVLGVTNTQFADAFPDRLPADDNSVDLVFSWTVLEHVPDLPAAYREMFRVLKPGGLMLHIVPNVMSAIDTIALDNVTAAKSPPTVHAPKGWVGAARHLWREYLRHVRGFEEPRSGGMVIPPCHSEFLSDYGDQLNLYISDSYLFPALRIGMQVERVQMVRDFNHALLLRKPRK